MGQLHNELRRGELSRALTRALGDSRGRGGLERYGETLQPILDLWARPEWEFLRGEKLLAQRISQDAVIGENAAIALVSPVGRNTICTVLAARVGVCTSTATTLELANDVALAAALEVSNAAPAVARDTRAGPGRCFTRSGSDAAISHGTTVDDVGTAVAQPQAFVALPAVLSPGFGLVMIGQTVNQTLAGIFVWRERVALPGELG